MESPGRSDYTNDINHNIQDDVDIQTSLHDDFRKTITGLNEGKIDSNNDAIINTIIDFQGVIEKSLEIAIQHIREESQGDTDLLKSGMEQIEKIKSINIKELNIAILRGVITQIADLIGFDFIVDSERGIDELGNEAYNKLSGINTIINGEYRYTYGSLYRGEKVQIEDESYIEEQRKLKQIKEKNAKSNEIYTLMEGLDEFGEVEYVSNSEIQEGPILVIFGENHNDEIGKLQNFKGFINNSKYFNFLGTEGGSSEMDYSDLNLQLNEIQGMLKNGSFGLSSEAIEGFLGINLSTIGVDLSNLKQLIEVSNNTIDTNFQQKSEDIMINTRRELRDILGMPEVGIKNQTEVKNDNLQDMYNIVNYYRNQIWLKNLQNITIDENGNGKNFIPIVCGSAHMDDLSENSKYRGFKGVIKFKGN